MPANWPTDSGDDTVSRSGTLGRPVAGGQDAVVAERVRDGCTCGDGQLASPTHRPGRSSYAVDGGTLSCIQIRSMGSSMTPLSAPHSQRSHQRTSSWRNPTAGPGWPRWGYLCDHGPTRPLRGTSSAAEQPEDRVGVAVGPSAGGEHRTSIAA